MATPTTNEEWEELRESDPVKFEQELALYTSKIDNEKMMKALPKSFLFAGVGGALPFFLYKTVPVKKKVLKRVTGVITVLITGFLFYFAFTIQKK